MSDIRFFGTHRTWEDWLGMLLGVLIVVSPWFPFSNHDVMDAERSTMILNTFVVGMLIFGLAQLEYVALQRWEEVGEIALGFWLIASPFIFAPEDLKHILGEVVSAAGKAQLRIAETEKYPHVTYFFNGGIERAFPREERKIVPSPKVATYDLQPEMSARDRPAPSSVG